MYRPSRFIDFDTCVVTLAPMDLLKTKPVDPSKRTLEDKLDLFECRVEVWQLGVAVAMLREIETKKPPSVWSHAAYGLISVVFSYFEMIGEIRNLTSGESGSSSEDFNRGFCELYAKFRPANGIYKDKLPQASGTWPPNPDIQAVISFRDRIRNGMYHLAYTKRGVQLHNDFGSTDDFESKQIPDPADASQTITIYRINPHAVVRTVVDHFARFMADLQTAANTQLRAKFVQFYDDFHDV